MIMHTFCITKTLTRVRAWSKDKQNRLPKRNKTVPYEIVSLYGIGWEVIHDFLGAFSTRM